MYVVYAKVINNIYTTRPAFTGSVHQVGFTDLYDLGFVTDLTDSTVANLCVRKSFSWNFNDWNAIPIPC